MVRQWNLVPGCKECNQTLKGDHSTEILNPTQQGFDGDAFFQIQPKDIKALRGESDNFECGWKIRCTGNKEKEAQIQNNIKLFQLNCIYQKHKDKIRDILNKKYYFDDRFKEEYRKRLNIESDEKLNYSIYGCSLNPKKFKDEIFSKMTYDLVRD